MTPDALPEHYLITPEPNGHTAFPDFVARLTAALALGVRLVQLRAKSMDDELYRELAGEVFRVCRANQARLILNRPAPDWDVMEADGMHLSSAGLMACKTRPADSTKLISAACHTREELLHAERIKADFVTLSPVLATASHPQAAPLGWAHFAQLAASVSLPIYALGGMTREHTPLAKAHGAHGIAAIRGLW